MWYSKGRTPLPTFAILRDPDLFVPCGSLESSRSQENYFIFFKFYIRTLMNPAAMSEGWIILAGYWKPLK